MKKKIISLILAFVLCFIFFVPFSVSAATFNGLDFSTDDFSSKRENILNTLLALRDNETIELDDFYCFISAYNSGSIFLLEKSSTSLSLYNGAPDYFCSNGRYFSIYFNQSTAVFRNSFSANVYISDLYNYDFSQVSFNSNYKCDVSLYSLNDGIGKVYDGTDAVLGKSYHNMYAANVVNQCLSYGITEVYIPNSFYTGVHFSFDIDDFYDWIVNNNKISYLPSYIVQSKLKSFLTFYQSYGASASSFFRFIPDWFSYMNIANQSNENVNILKASIDKLYKEYLDYRSSNHAYWPGALKLEERNDIDTKTDNNNTTLITDTVNDDDITLILRDILRGVIAIPNQLYSVGQNIIGALNQLDFSVNVANDGGVGLTASDIWGSGDITQSSNYQALSDAFVEHGVVISNVENLQYNYLAGQTQKDSFTVSVDMPDEYINGEFTKKTITHTVDSNSKMYDTLVLFRKIIALAVILFYVVRLKLALPELIKGE